MQGLLVKKISHTLFWKEFTQINLSASVLFLFVFVFLKVWAADGKSLPYPGGIPSPSAKIKLQGKRAKAASPTHHTLEEQRVGVFPPFPSKPNAEGF